MVSALFMVIEYLGPEKTTIGEVRGFERMVRDSNRSNDFFFFLRERDGRSRVHCASCA